MVDFESKMSDEDKEMVLLILKKISIPTTINEFLNTIDQYYIKHMATA